MCLVCGYPVGRLTTSGGARVSFGTSPEVRPVPEGVCVSDQTPVSPEVEQPRRPRHIPLALGVIIAIGVILGLVAIWFAACSRPARIADVGTKSSYAGGVRTHEATPSVGPTSTPQLTSADVRSVLGRIDYVERSDASTAEYNHAFTHMLEGIDLARFAQNALDTTRTILWTDVGAPSARVVTGAEKRRIIAESVSYWVQHRDSTGSDAPPLNAVWGVRLSPPLQIDRITQDSYYEVMAQGLVPLGVMFGAQDVDNDWSWRVTAISAVASDSADVSYVASTRRGARWHFANPRLVYTKHLQFSHDPRYGWRLSGWTNYADVWAEFANNVVPRDGATHLDEWWGSL
jgi:hypothetical protein